MHAEIVAISDACGYWTYCDTTAEGWDVGRCDGDAVWLMLHRYG